MLNRVRIKQKINKRRRVMSFNQAFDHQYKIIIEGQPAVGKSSIYQRFVHNVFRNFDQATIGVDFLFKLVECEDKVIRLQLWEMSGAER